MSAEDNLNPNQFKWTPIKFNLGVAEHLRKEHGIVPKGGWSRTYLDEDTHKAEHDKDENRVAGSVPHKHFVPAQSKKMFGSKHGKKYL